MPREHGKTGDFVETVTLDDVFDVFDAVRGPVVTSADVADALDCSRDTARRKLTDLHREERVARRKTAGRIIWWRTDDAAADMSEDATRVSEQ
jgi:CTP-dependent riboflavin kinase